MDYYYLFIEGRVENLHCCCTGGCSCCCCCCCLHPDGLRTKAGFSLQHKEGRREEKKRRRRGGEEEEEKRRRLGRVMRCDHAPLRS
jgi:hypothetical protein